MARRLKSGARRSAAEWAGLIEQQRDSGQTRAGFCRARGLSLSTFQYWKQRLRAEALPVPSPWMELVPQDDPAMPVMEAASRGRGGWEIELDLGDGIRLRLGRR
jgi:putative transposase